MKHRLLAAFLSLCLLLTSLPFAVFATEEEGKPGTVYGMTSGYLNVRKEPKTDSDVIGKLYNDDKVTVLGVSKDNKWYQVVTSTGITGWSTATYIRIDVVYEEDEDFEAHLTAQEFPDSYKDSLRKLHALYPNWIFQAQHLSMTWSKAVAAESEVLKNALDEDVSPEAWLSMEYGAYNWETKKYVEMDSGGWVSASSDIIAYYMDPRNSLYESLIYQFENLLYSEEHTSSGVKAILPSRYDSYAKDVIKAAKKANVSAYFLATRMTQEGSKIDGTWIGDDGTSYEGYYNFFNIGAYAGSQHGSSHGAVTNGAIYAKKKGWDTPYKCILGSAEEIGRGYIHRGQNTIYYQKFNVAGENLYNHQYMSFIGAPSSESQIRAGKITEEEKAGSMTFVIPVYKKMPKKATPKPNDQGNNNNFLEKLKVKGFKLSPTFDRYTMEYAVEVDKDTTEVTISATKSDKNATVTGTGTIQLYAGENLLPVTVTSTSGAKRTYTISVFCQSEDVPERPTEPSQPSDPSKPTDPSDPTAPVIAGTTYRITDILTGVEPDTTVEEFVKTLNVKTGAVKILSAKEKEKTEGAIVTGDIIQLYGTDDKLRQSIPVIIYGDVNGDGKLSTIDLRMICKHILDTAAIQDHALTAADVNGDEKLSTIDLRMICKFILGQIDTLQEKKGGSDQ